MAGTKEIKRRITSIKNTRKITKAMEMVAASKMKRSVSATLASRMYAEYSSEILASVAKSIRESAHPFFSERKEGKNLLVLITSNRGLCGGYNAQIIKKAIALLRTTEGEVDLATVGKKGDVAMRRLNQNIESAFLEIPDVNIRLMDVAPIAKMILDEFQSKKYKKVFIAYTHFRSALVQKPEIAQVLPISKEEVAQTLETEAELKPAGTDYLFEGNFEKLVTTLAEKITRMQIYQMILESNASEQSARMMAMKNASEASSEMIGDLTLAFNKARQANITREISEISAGMASVS